jgi:hypothetical protein
MSTEALSSILVGGRRSVVFVALQVMVMAAGTISRSLLFEVGSNITIGGFFFQSAFLVCAKYWFVSYF